MVCTVINNDYVSLLFSQTILHFERICKRFWKEVWRIEVAHLHNAARVFPSLS